MTDTTAQDSPRVRIPPPVLPVITILTGYFLEKYVPLTDAFDLATPDRYWIGAAIVVLSILILGVWPGLAFRKAEENPIPWTPTEEIIVVGPFRYTRNPMYLMMVLWCIGFAIVFSSVWILAMTPVCAFALYLFAIKPEEAYLEQKFGESYRSYKAKVRRWF